MTKNSNAGSSPVDRKVRVDRTYYDILLWLMNEECVPEGFIHVEADRYEYAMQVAEERGHDEPTDDDCLEGLCRLVDCAMNGGDRAGTEAPNVESEGAARLLAQLPWTDGLGVAVPSAPTFGKDE